MRKIAPPSRPIEAFLDDHYLNRYGLSQCCSARDKAVDINHKVEQPEPTTIQELLTRKEHIPCHCAKVARYKEDVCPNIVERIEAGLRRDEREMEYDD